LINRHVSVSILDLQKRVERKEEEQERKKKEEEQERKKKEEEEEKNPKHTIRTRYLLIEQCAARFLVGFFLTQTTYIDRARVQKSRPFVFHSFSFLYVSNSF